MNEIINKFHPITLSEMGGIKLMNRTDTKFVTTIGMLMRLLKMAEADYRIQEVDGVRNLPYFTVYFDTSSYDMFIAHQDGRCGRQKVRIRSYVNSNLSFLEVKTKDNHGRTKKKRIAIEDFDPLSPQQIKFHRQNSEYIAYDDFLRKHLGYEPEALVEQIENRFNRITLVNNAKTERVTIDTSLCFNNLSTQTGCSLEKLAIIELKRDGLQHSPILEMLRRLRIHPQGFSKYCMGSVMTNDNLKANRFKPGLRRISRIINDTNIKPFK
jgi:hypothetical protein